MGRPTGTLDKIHANIPYEGGGTLYRSTRITLV